MSLPLLRAYLGLLVVLIIVLSLAAWAMIAWWAGRSTMSPCHLCERGFPIGGWSDYPTDHAIEGWDGEVRFEKCTNPARAITHAQWAAAARSGEP